MQTGGGGAQRCVACKRGVEAHSGAWHANGGWRRTAGPQQAVGGGAWVGGRACTLLAAAEWPTCHALRQVPRVPQQPSIVLSFNVPCTVLGSNVPCTRPAPNRSCWVSLLLGGASIGLAMAAVHPNTQY
eukprot:363738-Chlamydomonas_euryale.AAC.14